MPEIFSNLGKIKVIEYGEHCQEQANWAEIRNNVIAYFKNLLK